MWFACVMPWVWSTGTKNGRNNRHHILPSKDQYDGQPVSYQKPLNQPTMEFPAPHPAPWALTCTCVCQLLNPSAMNLHVSVPAPVPSFRMQPLVYSWFPKIHRLWAQIWLWFLSLACSAEAWMHSNSPVVPLVPRFYLISAPPDSTQSHISAHSHVPIRLPISSVHVWL